MIVAMKATADDFHRAYSQLSDEALQALNREELTDDAREVYDEELASRGLASGEPEAEAAAAPGEADLVEIARFDNTDELELARSLLKSADIPSFLSSDPAVPGIFRATRAAWHELYVRPEDADEALAVLESEISEDELAEQAEAAGIEDEGEADEDEEREPLSES